MSVLLRALRSARAAARRGVPVVEYAAQRAEARKLRLSRRSFLEGSAAGALVTLGLGASATSSSGCSLTTDLDPRPFDPNQHEVAIVGGGLAGLTCAFRLSKLEVGAHVYDASPSFGGRVQSIRDVFPDGMHAELGGEFIDTTHTTMLGLAQELGVELLDYRNEPPDIAEIVAFVDGVKLDEAAILTEFEPLAGLIDRAVRELWVPDGGVSKENPNGGQRLDALSIAGWLDEVGYSQGHMRKLLDAAYTTEYGLDLDVSNALNFLLLVSSDTESFEIFGTSDERFHAKNGNASFVEALVAQLAPETLHPRHVLRALRRISDGRYLLVFDAEGKTVEVKARRAVLTLPFTALREVEIAEGLLPEEKLLVVKNLGYGKNAKLIAGFNARPWRTDHGSTGETFSDLPFQSTWETSRLQPGASGILTAYLGGKRADEILNGTPEEQLAGFLTQIDQVFPGTKAASNGKVRRAEWPRLPFFKASYSAPLVGELTRFGGVAATAVEGLHFAGEHTSTTAPGFMEGAAESGARAAVEVATALGVKVEEG